MLSSNERTAIAMRCDEEVGFCLSCSKAAFFKKFAFIDAHGTGEFWKCRKCGAETETVLSSKPSMCDTAYMAVHMD